MLAYGRQARVARADSPESWIRAVVVNLARRREILQPDLARIAAR